MTADDPKSEYAKLNADYKKLFGVSLDDTNLFHSAVGMAISGWSMMEKNLVRICAVLLGATGERTGIMLYSILSPHIWIQIIDDLFLLDGAYPEQKNQWGQASTKLRTLIDLRNRVAHHSSITGRFEQKVTLRASELDARSKSRKHLPLSLEEIHDFSRQINELNKKLVAIVTSLPDIRPETKPTP